MFRIPRKGYDGQASVHSGLRSSENNGRERIIRHVVGEAYYKVKGFRDSHKRSGDGAFDFSKIYFVSPTGSPLQKRFQP